MRKVFTSLITVVLFALLAPSVNATPINPDLIVNGSFETPDVPKTGYSVFLDPILGWNPVPCDPTKFPGYDTLGFVIIDQVEDWDAYSGEQFATVTNWYNSGIFQTIETKKGKAYEIDFAFSPRPGVGYASNVIELYIDDVLVDSVSGEGGGLTNTSWAVHQSTYTATGKTTTIKFLANGIDGGWPGLGGFIDDVQTHEVVHVSEPSTLLLLMSGLVGLVGYGRRHK